MGVAILAGSPRSNWRRGGGGGGTNWQCLEANPLASVWWVIPYVRKLAKIFVVFTRIEQQVLQATARTKVSFL